MVQITKVRPQPDAVAQSQLSQGLALKSLSAFAPSPASIVTLSISSFGVVSACVMTLIGNKVDGKDRSYSLGFSGLSLSTILDGVVNINVNPHQHQHLTTPSS